MAAARLWKLITLWAAKLFDRSMISANNNNAFAQSIYTGGKKRMNLAYFGIVCTLLLELASCLTQTDKVLFSVRQVELLAAQRRTDLHNNSDDTILPGPQSSNTSHFSLFQTLETRYTSCTGRLNENNKKGTR